jgi:hypothetical protein
MRKSPQHSATLGRHALTACTVLAACVGALVAACGGGDDELAAPIPPAAYRLAADVTPTAHWVELEGCVVDEYFLPRTGTPVSALAGDGRLLGTASSDMGGVFRLQVPARAALSIRIDKAGGESMAAMTGRSNLSVDACLRDPHA